ncbi:helix-turn-helix transcriptional regulator [Hujiaoplasma nucleasis]|uniref:Helix-turn-helix transcriptional regulator n=1 Tax=Hujiaoplasma nucleasis TaxID=2725268 RepID=A0A7L6N176_9MOLU|nr:metalloregulator ArsR/SmtB family transcription factor [Hujiaoplasma nucleasis]QLY40010.1 helix-turn-helix transcriptional regulator [Hujiaoplasma nucleasis]
MSKTNVNDVCTCNVVHPEKVSKAIETLPEDQIIFDLADFFKSISDSTRMKIILALEETELCVCDLSTVINISRSAVSHQLRVLRQARLVKFRKEGNVVYYSLDDEHVHTVIKQGLNHITHK